MRNVTLSADDHMIELGRQTAQNRNTTLNQTFRDWLKDYVRQESQGAAIDEIYRNLSHIDLSGTKLSREE